MKIRTLICKRDLETGSLCLGSLVKASREQVELIIHEDGTLNMQDINYLSQMLPGSKILRRREYSDEVEEKLAKHPRCREYRNQNPLSNKLLDIPLLGGQVTQYIDSDILFSHKFYKLFPEEPCSVLLKQRIEGYSGRALQLVRKSQRWVPAGGNSGLFRLYSTEYDLDYLEWFLGQEELWRPIPGLLEQTCLSLLLGSKKTMVFDTRQLTCCLQKVSLSKQTIAVHFLSMLKTNIPAYAEQSAKNLASGEIRSFRYRKAEKLTLAKIIERRVRRVVSAPVWCV